MIDTTGIVALKTIHQQLRRQGCELMLSGVQENVAKHLRDTNFFEELGNDNAFEWTREAMTAAQQRLLVEEQAQPGTQNLGEPSTQE
jgi:SulP family sulfate permease